MKYAVSALALAAAVSAAPASALVLYTEFGELPGATFGGSGISNDKVAITRETIGGEDVTLGLTVTPRGPGSSVFVDDPGVFQVGKGTAVGGASNTLGTLWQLGLYVDIGTLDLNVYDVILSYDVDPDFNNPGFLTLDDFIVGGVFEDTQHLLLESLYSFDNFPTVIPPFATDPFDPDGIADFDPWATGTYDFVLSVEGAQSAAVAVEANVVPAPAAFGLLGLGLLGLGAVRRRRR
ncbi:hypothetical protein B5C34_06940 [Pacificimonas flava]|uniref:PEP-CTERM protein-sorting domain-containing protein n=2 Tax=Pacificimonas TaxID=1960290 RepID=A0A219B5Y6_9SPHN|nr:MULTISPECIES: PEP-CTERM sorting domain-containing protein [Pacificimonas]MBZ6377040.1 PEP-CTERM sorting domain-containing protein [Pacificimonas aurantium]OWV33219.1 hypothetical protein B5C34_06940 [Pacificimonas flava]